jgi:hypothetical protein
VEPRAAAPGELDRNKVNHGTAAYVR